MIAKIYFSINFLTSSALKNLRMIVVLICYHRLQYHKQLSIPIKIQNMQISKINSTTQSPNSIQSVQHLFIHSLQSSILPLSHNIIMQNKKNNFTIKRPSRSCSSNRKNSQEFGSDCHSVSPRTSIMRIKQFHEAKYGVPCVAEIIEASPSQQALGSAFALSSKRTACRSCKVKTQNVQLRKCGKVGIFWTLLLLPCCLCLLPQVMDSCSDHELRCVLCWQPKQLKKAEFCNCE